MHTSTYTLAILPTTLACLLALSLPRSSIAGEISGTWDGVVSYSIQDLVLGQPTNSYSGSFLGVMTLDYSVSNDELLMYIGSNPFPIPSDEEVVGYLHPGSFGPNGAGGTVYGTIYPGEGNWEGRYLPLGQFSASYPSILPDGTIDTSYGSAVGDISGVSGNVWGTGYSFSISFSTIPEPSSIVLAASALLIIGIFAWVRRSGLLQGPRTV
jgi:hypothetical protein